MQKNNTDKKFYSRKVFKTKKPDPNLISIKVDKKTLIYVDPNKSEEEISLIIKKYQKTT